METVGEVPEIASFLTNGSKHWISPSEVGPVHKEIVYPLALSKDFGESESSESSQVILILADPELPEKVSPLFGDVMSTSATTHLIMETTREINMI